MPTRQAQLHKAQGNKQAGGWARDGHLNIKIKLQIVKCKWPFAALEWVLSDINPCGQVSTIAMYFL